MKNKSSFPISLTFILFISCGALKAQDLNPAKWPHLKGYWKFQDKKNLTKATVGKDLTLTGSQQVVTGPAYGDTATRIGIGSYYKCVHGIGPNGGGNMVNRYTLMFDFKVLNLDNWHCFFQTDTTNTSDGDCFIRDVNDPPVGRIGTATTKYTPDSVLPNKWYRLMISVNLGNTYRYYLNGKLVLDGNMQAVDARFALTKHLLFFADDDGEDDTIDVASVAIFDTCLSASDIAKIGSIDPCVANPPKISLGADTSLCNYLSFSKTATSGFKKYLWSTGDTTASLMFSSKNLGTGANYIYIRATDINGCYARDTMIINFLPPPAANMGKNTQVCSGSTIPIGGTAVSGNTYSWTSKSAGFTSASSSPTVSPTVNTTYYLKETKTSTGCFKNDSLKVTVNPLPVPNTGGNHAICKGGSYAIGGTAVTGHAYSWTSRPAGFTSTASNPTVTPTAATTYILTETLTATGCAKSDSAVITVNPLPVVNAGGKHAICIGNTYQLGGNISTGHTYAWTSKPAGFLSSSGTPVVSPGVNTTYYLTETITATGCIKSDSANITVNSLPDALTGGNTMICKGGSYQLGPSPIIGHTYFWTSNPKGFTSASSYPIVSPTTATTYYLTETITATGCSKTDSARISIAPPPNTGGNHTICAGSSITLGSGSVTGHLYAWTSKPSGLITAIANPTVSPKQSTTYYLIESIIAIACAQTDSAVITVNPSPEANAGTGQTICPGTTANIGAASISGNTYSWTSRPAGFSTSMSNPVVNPFVATTYFLTEKITATGCTKTDSVIINVKQVTHAQWTMNHFGKTSYFHAADSSLADAQYLWKFGDGDSATGHLAKHLYPSNKTYTASLKVSSMNGCTNQHDSLLNVSVSGIDYNRNNTLNFSVYPNPFKTSCMVSYNLEKSTHITIGMYDITGQMIGLYCDENQISGKHHLAIDAEKYQVKPGIYLLKIISDESYTWSQSGIKIIKE
jgi:hypothetical protein